MQAGQQCRVHWMHPHTSQRRSLAEERRRRAPQQTPSRRLRSSEPSALPRSGSKMMPPLVLARWPVLPFCMHPLSPACRLVIEHVLCGRQGQPEALQGPPSYERAPNAADAEEAEAPSATGSPAYNFGGMPNTCIAATPALHRIAFHVISSMSGPFERGALADVPGLLASWLGRLLRYVRAGVSTPPSDAQLIKDTYWKHHTHLTELERRQADLRQHLGLDYGPSAAYLPLQDRHGSS